MEKMASPTLNDDGAYKMISNLSINTPNSRSSRSSVSRIRGRFHRRVLFPSEPLQQTQATLIKWSDEELYALLTSIKEESGGKSKIAYKNMEFWNRAAIYVKQ